MLSTQKSNEHGRREETYHPDTQEYEGRGRRGMADWEIRCSPYLCGSCLCYQTQRGLEVYNTYQRSLLWGDQRSVAGALLSDSEQRVAEEYCKGLSDKEVARNLCKSFWTIKTQKRFQSYLYGIEMPFFFPAARALASFNRTFMELKSGFLYHVSVTRPSFNRTFMELKLYYIIIYYYNVKVSIVPLWNWNYVAAMGLTGALAFQSYLYGIEMTSWLLVCLSYLVSIVPLWNWNRWRSHPGKRMFRSFNRTFMELKCYTRGQIKFESKGFNRTFMELKCVTQMPYIDLIHCFNRTFMELKYWYRHIVIYCSRVSIVPLWNWNTRT